MDGGPDVARRRRANSQLIMPAPLTTIVAASTSRISRSPACQGDPAPERKQRSGPVLSAGGHEVVLRKPDRDENPEQRHRDAGHHDRRGEADRPAEKAHPSPQSTCVQRISGYAVTRPVSIIPAARNPCLPASRRPQPNNRGRAAAVLRQTPPPGPQSYFFLLFLPFFLAFLLFFATPITPLRDPYLSTKC